MQYISERIRVLGSKESLIHHCFLLCRLSTLAIGQTKTLLIIASNIPRTKTKSVLPLASFW